MALEAVVYQQELFGNNNGKDLYSLLENWSCDSYIHHYNELEAEEELQSGPYDQLIFENQGESFYTFPSWDISTPNITDLVPEWGPNSSSQESTDHNYNHVNVPPVHNNATTTNIEEDAPAATVLQFPFDGATDPVPTYTTTTDSSSTSTRPKRRRRTRDRKNKEDIENQRMTHIAVERNRRRQMNEYLAMLKSLMPDSYVQRGDQASIVGGAINYVKELEHKMQCLSAHRHLDHLNNSDAAGGSSSNTSPFEEFFTYPQYSSSSGGDYDNTNRNLAAEDDGMKGNNIYHQHGSADIEVTMVESHANLKIRSKQRPKQLVKLVSGLQSLRLPILHLSVSTVDHVCLYCINVKIDDDSKLTSVEEIATAVHQLLSRNEQGDI